MHFIRSNVRGGHAAVFNDNAAIWLRFKLNLGAAMKFISITIDDDILVIRFRVHRLVPCSAFVVIVVVDCRLILFDDSDALPAWIHWLKLPEIAVYVLGFLS